MTNNDDPKQMECSFLRLRVQYEFGFRNENIMWMKGEHLKMLCQTNCHKMLNFANFENRATNIQRGIIHVLLNSLLLYSRVEATSGFFEMQETVVFYLRF